MRFAGSKRPPSGALSRCGRRRDRGARAPCRGAPFRARPADAGAPARARDRRPQLDAVAFGPVRSFTGCGSRAVSPGARFSRGLPVIGHPDAQALAEESGAARVVACPRCRMREVYYAALEKRGARCTKDSPVCVAPSGCAESALERIGWLRQRICRFTETWGLTARAAEFIRTAVRWQSTAAFALSVDAPWLRRSTCPEKVAFTKQEL